MVECQEFLATVARRAQISTEQAERATAAALETLAERLTRGERDDLVEQLPVELSAWLPRRLSPSDPFDADEFLRRVAVREGTDIATAELHARAVFAALRAALEPEELDDLLADLPAGFRPIVLNLTLMPSRQFVGKVAERAALDDAQAWRATQAVLETLAERIPAGEVEDVMSRLPVQLHEPLRRGVARDRDHRPPMSAEEFVESVARREGTTADDARRHVQAVFATLREAITVEEFADIQVELPQDYTPLLSTR